MKDQVEESPPSDGFDISAPKKPEEKPGKSGGFSGLIKSMEKKVSSQWRVASGAFLSFSRGVSWKKDDLEEAEEQPVSRRMPDEEPDPRAGSRLFLFALLFIAALAVGIGFTVGALMGPADEGQQEKVPLIGGPR